MTGTTTTLCVRRATYWCPELQAEDPAKKGVCSNFLCDSKPGDELQLTGPSGKVMLIPGGPRQEGRLLELPVRLEAGRRAPAHRPVGQGDAHPRRTPPRRASARTSCATRSRAT